MDDLEKLQQDLNYIATRTQEVKDENETLRADNQRVEKDLVEKRKQHEAFLVEFEEVKERVDKLKKEESEIFIRIKGLKKEELSISGAITAKNKALNDMGNEVTELEQEKAKLIAENGIKSNELTEREQRVKTNEVTLKNFEDELIRRKAILDTKERILVDQGLANG